MLLGNNELEQAQDKIVSSTEHLKYTFLYIDALQDIVKFWVSFTDIKYGWITNNVLIRYKNNC